MLRKSCLVFGLCLLASLSARAQDDKVEVFGGYSYMHFHNSPSVSLNGWEASAQYKFTDWLGGVADFDGHYGSIHGAGTSTYTYLFGPQISYPARVSPFGHLLLGGAHLIDFCINNGIIGTGGERLCPDQREALIYWKIDASGL